MIATTEKPNKARTDTKTKKVKPETSRRRATTRRSIYVVAGIWNEYDGAGELVVNATRHDTLKEAKARATEWATSLYNEWYEDMRGSPFFDSASTFDDAWAKVDNHDSEFLDWGYDPVDNSVASVRIRVFKAYRGNS